MRDFSYEKYRFILKQIKKKYNLSGPEIIYTQPASPTAFIRHDIDFCLELSLKIAEIEYSEGIYSTYYIMLGSPYYNINDKNNLQIIDKIINLGHKIDLHYDAEYLPYHPSYNYSHFPESILEQKKILERITGKIVQSFSLHNPTLIPQEFLESVKNKEFFYEMSNIYYKFLNNHLKYCSDSNGLWRFESIDNVINPDRYPYLHLLIHPLWWSNAELTPREKIKNLLITKNNKILENYDFLLKKDNRINI